MTENANTSIEVAMRTILTVVVVATLSALNLAPCSATTFFDGTFADSDWTHTKVFDSTPGEGATFTAAQVISGGNPGAYQRGSHTWGPGTIYIAHLFTGGGTYDPAVEGAIARIEFSHDFIVFDASFRAVATALVLKQDGNYYIAPPVPPHFTFPGDAPWKIGAASFTAVDFGRVTATGLVPGVPDLSAAGGPIEFGYVSANTTSGSGTTAIWGIDNFSVTPIPEPSGIAILGTSAAALAAFALRRMRSRLGEC